MSKAPPEAGECEVARKQAAYLRTDLRLMIKANWQITDMQKHYREMLTKVDLIVGSGGECINTGIKEIVLIQYF